MQQQRLKQLSNRNARQLRIFDAKGNWINRADLMVLAAASHSAEFEIESLYRAMVEEDVENPAVESSSLSPRALRRGQKEIARRGSLHILAGEVVLEIARLTTLTGRTPNLNSARRVVAFNHRQFQGKGMDSAVERRVLREVERGFTKFRNIAHIRAALHYVLLEDGQIGPGEDVFRRILGIARTFENMVDRIASNGTVAWSPLRIPRQIEPVSDFVFAPMTREEIAASKAP